MNTIDELKMLLDDRGVEYQEFKTIRGAELKFDWKDECNCYCRHVGVDGSCIYAGVEYLEPDQAVDFALGKEIDGETSDGYHTFNELYRHRAVLFSVIVRDHKESAWKSKRHHDGTMFMGMFIVGIDTHEGQATYHYDIDPYWDMFDCRELERAPELDGHTPDDAIARIAKLERGKCKLIGSRCSECGVLIGADASMSLQYEGDDLIIARNQDVNFCPNCGRRVER